MTKFVTINQVCLNAKIKKITQRENTIQVREIAKYKLITQWYRGYLAD